MIQYALKARLQAEPGKEREVEEFLKNVLPLVKSGETAWFALKIAPGQYGIFDVSQDKTGRDAHLNIKVAEALKQQADELFAQANGLDTYVA